MKLKRKNEKNERSENTIQIHLLAPDKEPYSAGKKQLGFQQNRVPRTVCRPQNH
jgi:hypothetical protein